MQVEALFFDMFGTVVDWRSSIAKSAPKIVPNLYEPAAFADAWRAEYQPAMEEIRAGRRPYVTLDVLHRENLERITPHFGLDLDETQKQALVHLWHELDAWPDSTEALTRLREKFRLAPLSNGNIALMVDMARHNGFIFDAILGADIAHNYKPARIVYESACAAFGLSPDRCLMVAAHTSDLVAAKEVGLRTAHIARPDEHGLGKGENAPLAPVDLSASSLLHLAELLGA